MPARGDYISPERALAAPYCPVEQPLLRPEDRRRMHLANSLLFLLLVSLGCASNNNGVNGYAPKQPPLDTPWTGKVGTNPWTEYPRPQLQRPEWKNLNGIWRYQNASSLQSVQHPPSGESLSQEVLVPSCLESGLSGMLRCVVLF